MSDITRKPRNRHPAPRPAFCGVASYPVRRNTYDATSGGLRVSALRATIIAFTLTTLVPVCTAFSQPTQEEVFKSIGDTVNQPIDSSRFVATLAAIGGVVVLLVVVGHWRNRGPKSKSLDHPGKLMKEVLRSVPLKGSELKQIKLLAQDLRPGGTEQRVQSPLTLLLCPSLLGEAAKQSRGKADLPVVAGLVKKLVSRQ